MQLPTTKTPVSKCLDLAGYSTRMLARFPANPALAPLGAKMASVAQALSSAQTAYADAVKAILATRVDVKYENFVSDRRDTAMQDLFFDDVRAQSSAAQADEPGAEPSADGAEPPPAP